MRPHRQLIGYHLHGLIDLAFVRLVVARLPEAQQQDQRTHRPDRAQNIRQLRPYAVRDVDMDGRKHDSARQHRGPHLEHRRKSARDQNQISGQQQREWRAQPTRHAAHLRQGQPCNAASVITGMPMDPKATGAVFASRQIDDAYSAEKPKPTIIAAATATGVPNPAQPSMNAPNAKAINSACIRLSEVTEPIESLMTSNLPVVTVTSYSTIAQKMIQEMGKIPKHAPYAALLTAWATDIPYAKIASARVAPSPATAAIHEGLRLTASKYKSSSVGRIASPAARPRPRPKR